MLRSLVTVAWWLFGIVSLASVVLRPWVGDALMVTRYTGYVLPWLLVGLLPGALWAGLTDRRALAVALGAAVAAIALVQARSFHPRPRPPPDATATLDVMSYNVWANNRDVPRVAKVIAAHRPDILLLQELEPGVLPALTRALEEVYGAEVHVAYDPAYLQAVVSRYPIPSWRRIAHRGQAIEAVVATPWGRITVFDVHPLRLGGWQHRYGQVAALLEDRVLATAGPVILGGDLNAPEHSQLYRLLSSELHNAHDAAGFGLGFTYPAAGLRLFGVSAFPLVRIDHLFFNDRLVALRAETIADSGGSDHRPVLARLALRGAAPARPRAGGDRAAR